MEFFVEYTTRALTGCYTVQAITHILKIREVLQLLHREFIYIGDPIPELSEPEHAEFLINIQRSILLSLEQRKLLTASQRERCLVELETNKTKVKKVGSQHYT